MRQLIIMHRFGDGLFQTARHNPVFPAFALVLALDGLKKGESGACWRRSTAVRYLLAAGEEEQAAGAARASLSTFFV
jgi:hypothetical protein